MKTTHLLSVTALIPLLAAAADPPLFNYSLLTSGAPRDELPVKLREVSRTDTRSVVEISGATSELDAPKGFLLNGMCGLAKSRGQIYFQALEVRRDPLTYEVTFPTTAPFLASSPVSGISPNIFPVSRCPDFQLTLKK
jgi:hypothetical protein